MIKSGMAILKKILYYAVFAAAAAAVIKTTTFGWHFRNSADALKAGAAGSFEAQNPDAKKKPALSGRE